MSESKSATYAAQQLDYDVAYSRMSLPNRQSVSSALVLICIALPVLVLASSEPGLKKLWQIKVTQGYANAPQKSVIPVSIWALAFSPDGRTLAFAAGFIESNKPIASTASEVLPGTTIPFKPVVYPYKSYVFIVDVRRPDVSKKRFEIQMPPYLNRPSMMWSPSADAIAFQSVSGLPHEHEVHLLRISDGIERLVDIVGCNLKSLLDGFRLVAECYNSKDRKVYMRFFSVDGTMEREVEVPGIGSIKAVDARSGRLVLAKAGPRAIDQAVATYEMILLGPDGNEEHRWALPAAEWYDGLFADSGKRFCTASRVPVKAKSQSELTCWSVTTGERVSHQAVHYQVSPNGIHAGGLRISLPEADVQSVPSALQRLAGTSFYYSDRGQVIYDLQTGIRLAEWEIQIQHLVPRPATAVVSGYTHDIAPDGNTLAVGGEGVVTLYQLP